jgi:hypothetical protein
MGLQPPPAVDPLMDVEEIALWILKRLGAPIVTVELAECHLEMAVEDAKRWIAAKKGVIRRGELTTVPSQTIYRLPDDVDTVTEVAFEGNALDLSFTGLSGGGFFLPEQMSQIPYQALAAPSSGGLYSSITQVLQNIDMDRRVLSIDLDWNWFPLKKELFLTPTPLTSLRVIYFYKSRAFNISDLSEREHLLLRRYAFARAKEILGEIRGKYDGYPTAQGSASLNGASLKQEAADEFEKLDDDMLKETSALPIVMG